MQAAIDRVLRSLLPKPVGILASEVRPEVTPEDAERVADRLLENLKGQLARKASQHH